MPTDIVTALVAAFVALITAGITSIITWIQVQRERTKWLTDLKSAYSVELYKARLAEYPKIMQVIGKLSSRAADALTPERAQAVALELNDWFYSTGGLIAEASTRGALVALRDRCLRWKEGTKPEEIRTWRNAAVFALRRDLDIVGMESFGVDAEASLLANLKKEMDAVSK